MNLFTLALWIFAAGAAASLLLGRGALAAVGGTLFAMLGCAVGLSSLVLGNFEAIASLRVSFPLPFGGFVLGLDPLSKLFLFPVFGLGAICALSGAISLCAHESEHNLGAHWFFYNILLLALALVFAARDGVLFLAAWEVMSLTPFFLISFFDQEEQVREAAWIYLVAAHLGGVFLFALFGLLIGAGQGSDFAALASAAQSAVPAWTLFLLALLGFGAKAGIMPLHVWLPQAHPAAPSHVSALLSGVMINAGLYGLVRVLGWLAPGEAWWGWLLLWLGLASAFLGILQALAQRNLKRLLAYSSVENMGIALAGIGLWLIGRSNQDAFIAMLGIGGALFHVLNHSAFKGLLFLGAGEVLHAAGTIRFEHLGGLQKRMPLLGGLFLLGSASIAGLPPLNGFAGELMLYLGLASGYSLPGLIGKLGLLAGFCVLAFSGALALATFCKAYGMAFLGEPRSGAAAGAHSPSLAGLAPLAVLALCCLGLALAAPYVFSLACLAAPVQGSLPAQAVLSAVTQGQSILENVVYAGLAFALIFAILFLIRLALLRGRGARDFRTWDCGYAAPSARMQYSQASFGEPLAKLLAPGMGLETRLNEPRGYFPDKAELRLAAPDTLEKRFYEPLFEAIHRACDAVKLMQHGRIHLYILYILLTLVGLLCWKL